MPEQVPCPICGEKKYCSIRIDKNGRPNLYCDACLTTVFVNTELAYGGLLILVDDRKDLDPEQVRKEALENKDETLPGQWKKRGPSQFRHLDE